MFFISQKKQDWDKQFRDGAWEKLQTRATNTEYIANLLRTFSQENMISVLDVGCGNGALYKFLQNNTNISYTGFDFSREAVAQAKKLFPTGNFIIEDIYSPKLNLQEFDIIIFNEVLYYVNPFFALPFYKRYLKKQGKVIISIYKMKNFFREIFIWFCINRRVKFFSKDIIKDEKGVFWKIGVGYLR